MASFIWKVKVTWSELGTTRTCHENVVAATCLDAIDDVRNDFSDRVFINSMECESIGSIGTYFCFEQNDGTFVVKDAIGGWVCVSKTRRQAVKEAIRIGRQLWAGFNIQVVEGSE